jgi:hypothetical protein
VVGFRVFLFYFISVSAPESGNCLDQQSLASFCLSSLSWSCDTNKHGERKEHLAGVNWSEEALSVSFQRHLHIVAWMRNILKRESATVKELLALPVSLVE